MFISLSHSIVILYEYIVFHFQYVISSTCRSFHVICSFYKMKAIQENISFQIILQLFPKRLLSTTMPSSSHMGATQRSKCVRSRLLPYSHDNTYKGRLWETHVSTWYIQNMNSETLGRNYECLVSPQNCLLITQIIQCISIHNFETLLVRVRFCENVIALKYLGEKTRTFIMIYTPSLSFFQHWKSRGHKVILLL